MPSIYVTKDSNWYNAHSTDNYYIYSFTEWLTYEQVDSLVSTRSQYCGYGVIGEIEFIEQIFNVVINLFAIVGISLGVGMLLMIYLLMDKYTKYSAKSGGILLTNGISKAQWNICVLIQMVVICLISCCFSFVLTTAIYCLLGVGLNNLFVYGYAFNLITINGNYFLTLFGVEIAMLIIVSLSLFLINWLTTKNKSIKQLLNTNVS
jgi:hypothetical protein